MISVLIVPIYNLNSKKIVFAFVMTLLLSYVGYTAYYAIVNHHIAASFDKLRMLMDEDEVLRIMGGAMQRNRLQCGSILGRKIHR